jgi:hypothetical protein
MVAQVFHWFFMIDHESLSMHVSVFGIAFVVALVATGGFEMGVKLVRIVPSGDTWSPESEHYAVICLGTSEAPPDANVRGGWPISLWWR